MYVLYFICSGKLRSPSIPPFVQFHASFVFIICVCSSFYFVVKSLGKIVATFVKITSLHNKEDNSDTVLFTLFATKFNLPRIALTEIHVQNISKSFKNI